MGDINLIDALFYKNNFVIVQYFDTESSSNFFWDIFTIFK
jgi:hypothetical protein